MALRTESFGLCDDTCSAVSNIGVASAASIYGYSCLEDSLSCVALVSASALRAMTNSRLRTGTDSGNPTV